MIAEWIAKSMAGDLSVEEERQLEVWRRASDRNSQLYDRMFDQELRNLKKGRFQAFDKVLGWQGYMRKSEERRKNPIRWKTFLRYAAILLVPLGVVTALLQDQEEKVTSLADLNTIQPGKMQAELVLPDGQVFDLLKESGQILKRENTIVRNERNTLSYTMIGEYKPMDSLRYNEVLIPKGGEYKLELSDGTLVYLNSMTKIRFPEHFSEKCREVEVCGEAFFEVAKDEHIPFIVKTGAYEITVLGTKFNVTAYADEHLTTTTLVEGSVVISGNDIGKSKVLRPNEQLILNRQSGKVEVKKVDVRYSTAWLDGMFRFRDVRLEEIMRVVERWYDVTVVYEDEGVKDLQFGFNMSRHETIEPLLDIFELNGKIKIRKEGKVLRIKRGR